MEKEEKGPGVKARVPTFPTFSALAAPQTLKAGAHLSNLGAPRLPLIPILPA